MAVASPAVEEPANVGFLSAFKRPAIRILAVSRASSKLAQSTVSYGSMVYMATVGAAQWEISVVAASTYLSAVLFGMQGGTLADSLSKRIAIISGYIALAALCILTPIIFGTGTSQFMVIMFLSSALMQIVSPSLKSAVALVSSPDEMATVSASVSVVGSIASAVGSSLLAPILIKTTSIETLLYVAGAIYLFGAIRTYRLPVAEAKGSVLAAVGSVDWHVKALSRRYTAQWIMEHRAIAATILVGAIVVSLFEAFNTLIPVYVRDVLNADPTNAVYIFAPAGIGFLIGTFLTPKLIGSMGTRKLAVLAAVIMGISMILFGLIDLVAPILAPISPLRLLGWLFGIEISDEVLAASLIAIPLNFGSTAAGASVQTHINLRVPVVQQGATFGVQEVQENIFTLGLVLLLGAISSVVDPRVVFILAPIVAVTLVLQLIRYSTRVTGAGELSQREALDTLLEEDTE